MSGSKQVQTRVMRLGQVPSWHVKQNGERFTRSRGAFISGTEVYEGVQVDKTSWATVFAFGEWADVLAAVPLGSEVKVSGTWQVEDYTDPETRRTSRSFVVVATELVPVAAEVVQNGPRALAG